MVGHSNSQVMQQKTGKYEGKSKTDENNIILSISYTVVKKTTHKTSYVCQLISGLIFVRSNILSFLVYSHKLQTSRLVFLQDRRRVQCKPQLRLVVTHSGRHCVTV